MRLVDTRGFGTPIAAGASTALPAGLLTVTLLTQSSSGGDADVYPCAGSPDSEPTFHFVAPGSATRSITSTPNTPLCVRSTVPIHLIVDWFGAIATDAIAGGAQYQPLATPEQIASLELPGGYVGRTTPFPRGSSIATTASGAVYGISLLSAGNPSSVQVHACTSSPTYAPAASIDAPAGTVSGAVASIALGPTDQPCLTTYGGGVAEVTLLGTLNTDGPDPTRLPPGTTSRLVDVPPPGFVPISPDRAFDTRTDGSGVLLPSEVLEVDLNDYLTPSSTAVTMNVTVTGAQDAGFLTVWPCDETQPNASNLNFERGIDVPNLVTVRLSGDGTICINGSAPTHVIGDIAGTYELGDGAGSTPVAPTRILDTRRSFGGTILLANTTLTLKVAGSAGVPPAGAEAVTMNVTATGSQGDGYMTVWPCDRPQPDASNLNFRRGVDVPNLVTVKLSASGTVCFFSTATTHVLADAAMWFGGSSTGGFVDVTPSRVLDTRVPIGQPTSAKVPANGSIAVAVAGAAGVPISGAVSVTMNVTVANPASSGYLTVWPCNEPQPDASNLNFLAGVNVPNLVSVKLPPDGRVCFFSTATTDLLADVAGYTTDRPLQLWSVVLT